MNNQMPVIPPPRAGLVFKMSQFWTRWKNLPLQRQIIITIVLCTVLGLFVFGGWRLLNRPPEIAMVGIPVVTRSPNTETPPTSTPQPQPDPTPTPNQPTPPPSTPKPPANNNTGGGNNNNNSGGGGNNNGGGNDPGGGGNDFPNASNTGPVGCGSYTKHTGTLNITTDGAVLNCIELHGTLTINASNVTVQNSILHGDSWWGVRVGNTNGSTTNFRLLHSKLYTTPGLGPDNGGYDYGVSQEATGFMEIAYNDISGYKDGVTISGGNVHDNYIHNLSQFTGAHTQAIYVYTGPNQVKISHNTLINDSPQDQSTAAIYIAPDDGHQNDRIITNNFLAGGAYTIYGGDTTATNIVVMNNKFSTQIWPDSGYYGWAAYWWPNNSGNVWSGNTWADGQHVGQTLNP